MTKTRKTKGRATPLDAIVGAQIKKARSLHDVSQEKLAEKLDITFQQIQKYESGTNRVSSSSLFAISRYLDAPLEYFFEGAPLLEGEEHTGFLDDYLLLAPSQQKNIRSITKGFTNV